MLAPGRVPLYRFEREYAWYVREGIHVRSPVKYDGVTIAEDERRRYEEDWFRREHKRQAREAEKKAKGAAPAGEQAPVPGGTGPGEGAVGQVLEPRFVSVAYFLDFKSGAQFAAHAADPSPPRCRPHRWHTDRKEFTGRAAETSCAKH